MTWYSPRTTNHPFGKGGGSGTAFVLLFFLSSGHWADDLFAIPPRPDIMNTRSLIFQTRVGPLGAFSEQLLRGGEDGIGHAESFRRKGRLRGWKDESGRGRTCGLCVGGSHEGLYHPCLAAKVYHTYIMSWHGQVWDRKPGLGSSTMME